MRLLRFFAENHRSFRDEFTLDMTRSSWRTALPSEGQTWDDVCLPVAAIFGPNASGKSAVLDALKYAFIAIAHSASSWLQFSSVPRAPFRLVDRPDARPSFFALDFTVIGGLGKEEFKDREVRYHYEFSVSSGAIEHELLLGYFSTRPTRLLERESGEGILTWHKYLGPRIDIAPRELALSRGFVSGHRVLQPFVERIVSGVDIFDIGDDERGQRLDRIANDLARGRISLEVLATLAAVADIGITDIDVDERKVPPEIREFVEKAAALGRETFGEDPRLPEGEKEAERRELISRTLRFYHHGKKGASNSGFSMHEESSGTLAWLAMAVPLLEALRDGTVFCVDELDTSLHPELAGAIVALFQDPEINSQGAQLIFTSHDVSLLQPMSPAHLEKAQVWFTEKDIDGASTLFSLQDFSNLKAGSNVAKQYLEGRFGALPLLLPGLMRTAIAELKSVPQALGSKEKQHV